MWEKMKRPSNPQFSLRLEPAERARWQEVCEADGFRSLGTWLKTLARRRAGEWGAEKARRLAEDERGPLSAARPPSA
jgi:hypothetical protein